VWLLAGSVAISAAIGAAFAAITLSDDTGISAGLLAAIGGVCLFYGVTCMLAHVDVNRGRKTEQVEIEEEVEELEPGTGTF
jgi:hypothetical protein